MRIRPKTSVSPLASRNSSAPKLSPLSACCARKTGSNTGFQTFHVVGDLPGGSRVVSVKQRRRALSSVTAQSSSMSAHFVIKQRSVRANAIPATSECSRDGESGREDGAEREQHGETVRAGGEGSDGGSDRSAGHQ